MLSIRTVRSVPSTRARWIMPWLFIFLPPLAFAEIHSGQAAPMKSASHMMPIAPANAIPAATALLEGYGTGGFTIKTSSQDAQAYRRPPVIE